jgi:hypothetical protein
MEDKELTETLLGKQLPSIGHDNSSWHCCHLLVKGIKPEAEGLS